MQSIFCKGALVLLQLEIVLVFGKILDHGDESVSDEIPHFQRFVGSGTGRAHSLTLGFGPDYKCPFR
jgi:hypothetical protein